MILNDTIIQWMDVCNEKVYIRPVSGLFEKYAFNAVQTDDDQWRINIKEGQIKITDGWGWTDLLSITAFENIEF